MTGRISIAGKARPTAAALLIGTAGALVCAEAALGQDAGGVTIDVSRCIELTSPEERLACYEARVGEAIEGDSEGSDAARRDGPPTAPPAPEVAAPASEAAQPAREPSAAVADRAEPAVNRVVPVRSAEDARAESEPEGEPTEILGTIATLREREPHQYLITLDNGQVWYQVRPERYGLRVGHRVRLYPTRWGESYRLTVEELGSFIQVRRVR